MTFALDSQTLQNRFTSVFPTLRPTVPVIYDNAPASDPSGMFVRFSVRPGDVIRQSFVTGSSRWLQLGRVFVQIVVPKGEGTGTGLAIAGEIATMFRLWRDSSGNLRTINPSVTMIPAGSDETHYVITVSIPYESTRVY